MLTASPSRPQRIRQLLFLLIALVIGFGIWGAAAISAAGSDAERLSELSSAYLEGTARIILIHRQEHGTFVGPEELAAVGARWSNVFGLPEGQWAVETGRPVYSAQSVPPTDSKSADSLSIRLIGMDNGTMYSLVRLELAASPENAPAAAALAEQYLAPAFMQLDMTPEFNIMLQGDLKAEYSPQTDTLESRLEQTLGAAAAGQYADARTYSWSFASPRFGEAALGFVPSMNVQVAVHQNTEDGRWRMTWGLPLITVEY